MNYYKNELFPLKEKFKECGSFPAEVFWASNKDVKEEKFIVICLFVCLFLIFVIEYICLIYGCLNEGYLQTLKPKFI